MLELQSDIIAQLQISIPLPALIGLQMIQTGIIFAVLIFLGLILMKRIGLSTPILDAVTRGESASDRIRAVLPVSILLGVIASVLIIGLDMFLFQPLIFQELGDKANAIAQTSQPAAWKGFLASFYEIGRASCRERV